MVLDISETCNSGVSRGVDGGVLVTPETQFPKEDNEVVFLVIVFAFAIVLGLPGAILVWNEDENRNKDATTTRRTKIWADQCKGDIITLITVED